MTLRSDGFDLYAQPDGGIVFGKPGMPLNVTADGPALKGATNILLGEVDHRETALGPVAFAQIYQFITGHAPTRIAIGGHPQWTRHARRRRRADEPTGRRRTRGSLPRLSRDR
jgi:hypothetical protein